MRFRTITETPPTPGDQVFRQSHILWLIPTVIGLAFFAVGVGFIRSAPTGNWPFAAIATVITVPFAYLFAMTHHQANWIVRYRPPILLIQFRSHTNRHLSDDDPVILELNTSEIAWVRKVRAKISMQLNPIVFLDLKLKAEDLSQLREQLAAEAQRRRYSFRIMHEPVLLLSDGVLRIEWRGGCSITPSADKAIAMLQAAVPIGPPADPHIQPPARARPFD